MERRLVVCLSGDNPGCDDFPPDLEAVGHRDTPFGFTFATIVAVAAGVVISAAGTFAREASVAKIVDLINCTHVAETVASYGIPDSLTIKPFR